MVVENQACTQPAKLLPPDRSPSINDDLDVERRRLQILVVELLRKNEELRIEVSILRAALSLPHRETLFGDRDDDRMSHQETGKL
jgi:hypothetical protein